jgi:hypothetical protein
LQVVIDSDENLLINDGGMTSLLEFKSPLDIKKIDSLKSIHQNICPSQMETNNSEERFA